jgi:hypothetical protein
MYVAAKHGENRQVNGAPKPRNFQKKRETAQKQTTKTRENTSKSAWREVIKVCELTMILARATAPYLRRWQKFQRKTNTLARLHTRFAH